MGIFDHIFIREHDDPRGRQPGEVAAMLRDAVLATGQSPERVRVVLEEIEAADVSINLAAAGDLVVVMAYRVGRVWEALARRQSQVSAASPPAPLRERGQAAVAVSSQISLR